MGCYCTTDKTKLKYKNETSIQKEMNSKQTQPSLVLENKKFSKGDFENYQIFNKMRNLENNDNIELLVEKKPEFERISPYTIVDGIFIIN